MRIKIKGKVKRNTLNKRLLASCVRETMNDISKDSLKKMGSRLNKTEPPETDPRKSHVDVKKWRVTVESRSMSNEGEYTIRFRAINHQAPSYYTSFRTTDGKGPTKLDYARRTAYGRARLSDARKDVRYRKVDTEDYDNPRPISREEYQEALKTARDIYKHTRKNKGTVADAREARLKSLSRYRKLAAVRVTIDNIAFSRLFSAKNTIRPNKRKYGPYTYARCLKIWHNGVFDYAMYANPPKNKGDYYRSRVAEMANSLVDTMENTK